MNNKLIKTMGTNYDLDILKYNYIEGKIDSVID